MATWPVTLPTAPLLDAFRVEAVDQCVSTQMDAGPPKRRRRFSVGYGIYPMSFILTATQRSAFETFYRTTLEGGALAFDGFTDPTDGSSTATWQFTADGTPRWTPITCGSSSSDRSWRVDMRWERLT